MCGIVAAVAQRDVAPLLIVGLKALEYRGYDSSGVAVLDRNAIHRVRARGKVREMEALYLADPFPGSTGIAHTRWATHGVPNEANAHPHVAGRVAIVHNGIIENYVSLRAELQADGHVFTSETDTEVMAALIDRRIGQGMKLREAVLATVRELEGAYAIAVVSRDEPGHVVGARRGAPLLVGVGIGENFLGSDAQALIQVTNKMVYLDEGDVVEITRDSVQESTASTGTSVERAVHESELVYRCGRAWRIPPLHADGNLRAAKCGRQYAGSAHWPAWCAAEHLRHRQRCPAAARAWPAHHRLRHQLPRGPGRQVTGSRNTRGLPGQRGSSQ